MSNSPGQPEPDPIPQDPSSGVQAIQGTPAAEGTSDPAPTGEKPGPDRHGILGGVQADGVLRQVDPAYRDAELLGSWIGFAVVAGGTGVGGIIAIVSSGLSGNPILLVAGAWVLLAGWLGWLSARWPGWTYARTQYALFPDGIEIRKGVLWRRIINIPRSRVQHTDVIQGPIMRRFGIAVLRIHTAGTENAQVDLPGLRHETALRVRDAILRGRDGGLSAPDDDAV